ncbi:MAG: biotin--[acetyl-CoA-carboxylase] ligase [Deltaproteobacteria bacterium]|nr:biotin--[acetyl-CoA-carboxylase] ligase [Deltaproteobacteria bacterium]
MTLPGAPAGAARWLGAQRIDLEVTGSTNDEAARLARAGASHGTIVVAERQTAGRGREGRAWSSPPGMGLYLSAVLRPPLPLALVPPITLAIGVAVCDAAIAFGAPATLKWPNDTLVGERKLAGVLVEAQSQGGRLDAVIAGIGVNLAGAVKRRPPYDDPAVGRSDEPSPDRPRDTSGALPPEVADVALTLEEATGKRMDGAARERFLATLLGGIERWVDRYIACGLEGIAPAWHERMARGLVARATVDGAHVVGQLVGLDGDGALLLRDGAGRQHRVRAGDVEVIRPTRRSEPLATTC